MALSLVQEKMQGAVNALHSYMCTRLKEHFRCIIYIIPNRTHALPVVELCKIIEMSRSDPDMCEQILTMAKLADKSYDLWLKSKGIQLDKAKNSLVKIIIQPC